MVNREEERRAAYQYLVRRAQLFLLHWDPSLDPENKLAEALAPRLEYKEAIKTNIRQLRDGVADPSPELIAGFRQRFGKIISRDDIAVHLEKPFTRDK